MPEATFENLHSSGAEKHGALWLWANQRAVELSMGYELDYEKHKEAISHIVKWTLDLAKRYYDPETP